MNPGDDKKQAGPDEHTQMVERMFSGMAGRYDLQNHLFSLGFDYWWRRRLVQSVVPGPAKQVLDMAAGTLDVSLAVIRRYPQVRVIASDISGDMLDYGFRKKVGPSEAARLTTLVADARAMPLPDASMDAVTMAFGIRNVARRERALAEMLRMLVPGGRACVLEFAPVTTPVLGFVYHLYLHKVLPILAAKISGSAEAFAYFARSIQEFPAPPVFCAELKAAGFPFVQHTSFTMGIAHLYVAIKA